jgi:hypothetical protein
MISGPWSRPRSAAIAAAAELSKKTSATQILGGAGAPPRPPIGNQSGTGRSLTANTSPAVPADRPTLVFSPSKSSSDHHSRISLRRDQRQPLMESAALQSVVCAAVPRSWVSSIPRGSVVSGGWGGLPATPFPSSHCLAMADHPLVSFALLQSSLGSRPPACVHRTGHLPWGSFPLRDVSA